MLRESLSKRVELTDEAFQSVAKYFNRHIVKRKEHWLSPGNICDSIAFITKGCVRIYFPKDGIERTAQFFFEGSWVTDYESLHTNQISTLGIDALEDTELLVIPFADLQRMYDTFPDCERIGRLIAEQTVVDLCYRYRSLLNDSPLERYVKLIAQRPEVADRIPQHFIASYLGIEPESLSRIRKKISCEADTRLQVRS